ncbi:MAG: substrate binding domain-containing protein, partial [Ferrovibrio sp.]
LDLSDGYIDLVGERIDLAIRIAAGVEAGLAGHRLAPNRRVLCASPEYLQQHGAPARLQDLRRHRLLAAEGQLPWRLQGKGGQIVTVPGDSAVRTNSSEVVRELAIAGFGIALRSTWDVGNELRSGVLTVVLPDHLGAADVNIFAIHPASNFVPAGVRAFIEHLRAIYGAEPSWDRALAL